MALENKDKQKEEVPKSHPTVIIPDGEIRENIIDIGRSMLNESQKNADK